MIKISNYSGHSFTAVTHSCKDEDDDRKKRIMTSAAKAFDEELRRSATEASIARSRITARELEDIRLSYDIPAFVTLRTPGPEERADDPPKGFVAIYEPAMQQGLRQPMHHFFRESVAEAGRNLTPRKFESIYRACRSVGWYNVSPWPGQKLGTATNSPNKVYNSKEMFFFMGGDWEFMPEDPLPYVSIPH
ncbi:Plus3 domain-containing protein [Abeliophyllum distichum]|uniref:Plus3 domain-containing protein n=1 Tax=Abeliophyllum distichum TaxID=126358 RepID=A0ABD1SYT4_9LAMI